MLGPVDPPRARPPARQSAPCLHSRVATETWTFRRRGSRKWGSTRPGELSEGLWAAGGGADRLPKPRDGRRRAVDRSIVDFDCSGKYTLRVEVISKQSQGEEMLREERRKAMEEGRSYRLVQRGGALEALEPSRPSRRQVEEDVGEEDEDV